MSTQYVSEKLQVIKTELKMMLKLDRSYIEIDTFLEKINGEIRQKSSTQYHLVSRNSIIHFYDNHKEFRSWNHLKFMGLLQAFELGFMPHDVAQIYADTRKSKVSYGEYKE